MTWQRGGGAPLSDDQPVLRPRRPRMRGCLEHASQILQVRYPKLAPADVPCVQDERILATVLLRYGTGVEPGRSRTTQPSSIPQRSRCGVTPTYPDGILACFTAPMLTHWLLLDRAVSWTSVRIKKYTKPRHKKTRWTMHCTHFRD